MRDVRSLASELVPSAARLLAGAYLTNPAHVSIFPDFETRSRRLEWLLGANLRVQLPSAQSFCLVGEDAVIAMGFWTNSLEPEPGPLRKMRGGLLAAPFRLGLKALRRALEVSSQIDREVRLALGETPYWYLNNMAVVERLRGRGLGRELLESELERFSRSEPNFTLALSTQRSENVSFYKRVGFEPIRDEILGEGHASFRNWTMRYAPAA